MPWLHRRRPFAAGKVDWGSAGLPLEGDDPSEHRAGAYARRDVPTCRLDDRLANVRTRAEETGWGNCFAVDDHGVLLGRTALRRDDSVSAAEATTPGPSTVRPSLAKRMREQNLTGLPVTTSDGRLIGILQRDALEAALGSE
jgi:CBS domain-containing protein